MKKKFVRGIVEPDSQNGALNKTVPPYYFICRGNAILVEVEGEDRARIPALENISFLGTSPEDNVYLGSMDRVPCYGVAPKGEIQVPSQMKFHDLRFLFSAMDAEFFHAACLAVHLVNWHQTTRFCGRCGTKTESMTEERAKKCPECNYINYPRLSPAVIMAVIDGDKILLARSRRFTHVMYSVLAGFVEPGENLEECVRREVKEEVGISVKNIKYFKSQPWPFPDSLMIGFTAEYAGGELVIDDDEIMEAGWYTADNLPVIPGKISIARALIDWFVENRS